MTDKRTGGSCREFWKGLKHHPGSIGAVVPSSKGLARRMAGMIDPEKEKIVVELGAGTGAVTAGLLERVLSQEQLIVVEFLPEFVEVLRSRFPGITIIQADAMNLDKELIEKTEHSLKEVTAIVSSLPLRSIGHENATKITNEWKKMQNPEAKIVQFTYDLRSWKHSSLKDFNRLQTRFAFFNIPPARVDLLQLKEGIGAA